MDGPLFLFIKLLNHLRVFKSSEASLLHPLTWLTPIVGRRHLIMSQIKHPMADFLACFQATPALYYWICIILHGYVY